MAHDRRPFMLGLDKTSAVRHRSLLSRLLQPCAEGDKGGDLTRRPVALFDISRCGSDSGKTAKNSCHAGVEPHFYASMLRPQGSSIQLMSILVDLHKVMRIDTFLIQNLSTDTKKSKNCPPATKETLKCVVRPSCNPERVVTFAVRIAGMEANEYDGAASA